MKVRLYALLLWAMVTLLSGSSYAAMSDESALDLVRAMNYSEYGYQDIVLILIADGRTLPEATEITVHAVNTLQQRTEVGRTVMCMSRDSDEAESVTKAAIAAVPLDDLFVNEIVSELAKYRRSTCLDSDVVDRPPEETSMGSLPLDVSTSR